VSDLVERANAVSDLVERANAVSDLVERANEMDRSSFPRRVDR
jgi:hypothetical protein